MPAQVARRIARRARFLLVMVALSAAVGTAAAQSSIRALVNDQPITSFDVKARTQMLRVFSRGAQGEKEALDQLIDERLMLQEAARRNVTVSDAEVDAEVANRARQSNVPPGQFEQALRQAGIEPETFRAFIRANLAWSQIVRARFRATVEITDQDVAAALGNREASAEEQTTYEYMVQQILFVGGAEAQQRSRANTFRSGFQGCEGSLQQATAMTGVVVKPIVRREESALPEALREEMAALPVGGITAPLAAAEGIQLLAICEKRPIPGETRASEEVRSEITSERGRLLARRYLRDLRSDAVIDYR